MPDEFDNLEDAPEVAAPVTEDGLEGVETSLGVEEDGLEHVRIDIRKVLPDRRLDKYLARHIGKSMSRTALRATSAKATSRSTGGSSSPATPFAPATPST